MRRRRSNVVSRLILFMNTSLSTSALTTRNGHRAGPAPHCLVWVPPALNPCCQSASRLLTRRAGRLSWGWGECRPNEGAKWRPSPRRLGGTLNGRARPLKSIKTWRLARSCAAVTRSVQRRRCDRRPKAGRPVATASQIALISRPAGAALWPVNGPDRNHKRHRSFSCVRSITVDLSRRDCFGTNGVQRGP